VSRGPRGAVPLLGLRHRNLPCLRSPPACLGELLRGRAGGREAGEVRWLKTAAPGTRGSGTRAWMWGTAAVPLPRGDALVRFWEEGGQGLLACPVGPGVTVESWGDKKLPIPAGCVWGPHKARHPLAPALSFSSLFLFFYSWLLTLRLWVGFTTAAQNTGAVVRSGSLRCRNPTARAQSLSGRGCARHNGCPGVEFLSLPWSCAVISARTPGPRAIA